jgi:hypothetical protein
MHPSLSNYNNIVLPLIECCEKVVENIEEKLNPRFIAWKKDCPLNIELVHWERLKTY